MIGLSSKHRTSKGGRHGTKGIFGSSQDDEVIFYCEDIVNQIQNIFLTSRLRKETFHPRTTSPHPHPKILNKDEGIYQQIV